MRKMTFILGTVSLILFGAAVYLHHSPPEGFDPLRNVLLAVILQFVILAWMFIVQIALWRAPKPPLRFSVTPSALIVVVLSITAGLATGYYGNEIRRSVKSLHETTRSTANENDWGQDTGEASAQKDIDLVHFFSSLWAVFMIAMSLQSFMAFHRLSQPSDIDESKTSLQRENQL
ncbi:MAG: hypothetical protein WBD22_00255 [Pyrinomonadaceae bacterium]